MLFRSRKAAEKGICITDYTPVAPNDKEIALIQTLADYPAVVKKAGTSYSPALIANYVYDLVKQFNQFYHDYTILGEEDEAVRSLRLALCEATSGVISSGMALLGIRVPERM